MTYTDDDHRAALQAARNGQATAEQERKLQAARNGQATAEQERKLQEAARQAGSRGDEARRALQGKK